LIAERVRALRRPIGRIDIVQRDTHQFRADRAKWGAIAGSARRHVTIQVKYTNQLPATNQRRTGMYNF
jgi:hypothetical protein